MLKIPVLTYSRVSGYYNPISQFNRGKKEEFNERKYMKIPESVLKVQDVEPFDKMITGNL